MTSRVLSTIALAVTGAALVAGCSAAGVTTPAADGSGTGNPVVAVVASTNVWGSVASAIGGAHVKVTTFLSDPSADPHSYEAGAQDQLAISKARLIIENGGGYDDFMQKMTNSARAKGVVINAVDVSGYAAAGGAQLNEHVWYDLPTVDKVVARIRSALTAADPTHTEDFAANAAAFTAKTAALQQQELAIKAKSQGVGVAITEPVPLYLLDALGLANKTPPEFSDAVESETDAPATVVAATLALFKDKKVKALVYNEQTTGPQTLLVLAAAKANGIAVVPVTETLPGGTDYLGWMGATLAAVAAAVA